MCICKYKHAQWTRTRFKPFRCFSVQSDATVDSGFGSQPMEEEEPPMADQWQAGNKIPSGGSSGWSSHPAGTRTLQNWTLISRLTHGNLQQRLSRVGLERSFTCRGGECCVQDGHWGCNSQQEVVVWVLSTCCGTEVNRNVKFNQRSVLKF